MQIRMKVHLSGTRDGQEWPSRGSVIDLPDSEATDYINAGVADAVTTFPAPVETATPPTADVEKRSPKPAVDSKPQAKPGLTKANTPGF